MPDFLGAWPARLLACVALVGCCAGQALAQPSDFDAARWLARVEQAAVSRNYRGTMVVASGGVVSSSRVGHLSEGGQRYERIEVLDGQARQQFRHNDVVLTLWPQTRVAVFEQQQDTATDFPALPSGSQRLLESYDVRWIGQERIAGLLADVVVARPRDTLRFAQRLWAARDGGLLVRADVLGPRGEVLESSAFTDLRLGERLSVQSVLGPMKRLDGYRVMRSRSQQVRLDAEGWSFQNELAGFRLVRCARRMLDAPAVGGDERQVIHAVFSDGLASVSVFIEPYDAGRHKAMRTSLGATHTLMNRHGDWWITVVGDAPIGTIQHFEASLQRR